MPKTLPSEKARQGRGGRQLLFWMIVALILACIVWLGTEFYGQAIDDNPPQKIESM